MEIRRLLARNIRRFRGEREISQEELAHQADIHRTYISGLERGVRNPTVLVLARLAIALKVEPADLLAQVKASAKGSQRK